MMKTKRIMTVMLAIMLLSIMQVSAQFQRGQNQKGEGMHLLMFLDLSEEQETQAKAFYSQMKEKTTPIQLDVTAKEVRLQKLMIADKIEENTVFAMVDEISALKAQIRKARLQNKIKLRSILTDDQRVIFDANGIDRRRGRKQFQDQPRRQCINKI